MLQAGLCISGWGALPLARGGESRGLGSGRAAEGVVLRALSPRDPGCVGGRLGEVGRCLLTRFLPALELAPLLSGVQGAIPAPWLKGVDTVGL